MMDNLQFTNLTRGYHSILLEEIALEGLDGITLDVLWIRLKNNPDWYLKPIDSNIQEFVWKKLLSLEDVRWYDIKQPRKIPPIFSSFEDFYAALENDLIQSTTYSSKFYLHALVHDGDIIGSCSTYRERIDVTNDITKLTLAEANERYSNQLIIVASQEVRNYFLLAGNANPEVEIPDLSYCILERIGRSRNCGELSTGLQFLRNGANPTFYFWNKLKKIGLITAQSLNLSHKLCNTTLFYLPKFHRNFTNDVTSSVYAAVSAIKSSPQKLVPLVDIKALFPPERRKALKSDVFRRYIKIETIPFKECYPDSADADRQTKGGSFKVVRVAKLVSNDIDPEIILRPAPENEEEIEKQVGILKGSRLFNRPLIVQCYNAILEKGVDGISMADVGAKLGLNKLVARLLLKSLKRVDLVSSLSFDNGRQRYYRYYAKKYNDQVQEKLQDQLGKSFSAGPSINTEKENEKSSIDDTETKDSIESNTPEKSSAMEISENTLKRKSSDDIDSVNSPKKLKTASSVTSNTTQNEENSCEKSNAKTVVPATESVYFIRRTNIILEYVYHHQVAIANNLLKVIRDEEIKLGVSTGTPCSKTIKRIVSMLVQSNKLKEIKKVIVEVKLNKTREVNFICAPSVTEEHPIIQTTVANIQKNLSILFIKPSLGGTGQQVQEFRSKLSRQSRSKENDLKYDFAPKFARMRILHEFIIYLVYHYEGNENFNQDECVDYVRNFCSDFDKNEEIPKVYFKEISSRMFVPPLIKYEEYDDGWASLNDIIERMPLKMLFSLVRFSYYVPGIEAYLKHPVKQFYLMRNLPYDIQQVITADKKYISSISSDIRNLCLVGLAQLGPKVKIRGNTNLIYMNTKTELMDTRPCPPTFFQINADLTYTKYHYDFISSSNTETYWNDAFRFCVGTRLCRKQSSSDISKNNRKLKPELLPYVEERQVNEASKHDTGKVPGDGLGAAGYDSSLYSHFIKQWFLGNSEKSAQSPATTKTSTKQLRLKSTTQLKRMRLTLQKKKTKKKYTESYDKKDLEALQKMQTSRAQWSKTEDEILLLCYVASRYYIPAALSSYMPGVVFRKILHEKSEISASKTSHSSCRRIKNMLKNPLRRHTSNLLLKDVLHNDELRSRVQSTIDEIDTCSDSKDTTQCVSLLDKLTEQVFEYLYKNSKLKINASKGSLECNIPDTLEEFRNNFVYEYPGQETRKISRLPLMCENDAIVIVLTALIYSTLFSQVDKSKSINVNYLYQIFKHFDDDQLKLALTFVRANRLVSLNKYGDRLKSSLLPIGKGTYHFSITFHTILKTTYNLRLFSLVYEKCLEFLRKTDTQTFDIDLNDVGINLILIGYMIHHKIDFSITVPDNIMFFNSSPVVEVDPENTARPMFGKIESHTQKTLSLIRDTFFKKEAKSKKDSLFLIQDTVFESEAKNEDESNKKSVSAEKEKEKFNMMSDSDSEDDLSLESDDKLEQYHGRRSKIAIFLTRSQFKQSYVRFSNAYDHFLINKFAVSFELDPKKSCFDVLAEGTNFEYCKKIEKNLTYKKIKYTSTELTEIVKKKLDDSRERDCALHVLEYLQSVGVAGADSQMMANEFRDLELLKKVTDMLCHKKLVLRSGSQYTHYIHIDYAYRWLIPCWRNIDAFYSEKNSTSDSALPVVSNRVINEKFELRNDKNQFWLTMRPWMQINGTVNKPALESLLVRVSTHICKNPGTSLDRLQRKFEPALLPQWTRELLEILLELQVVQWNVCQVPKVTLFSKSTSSTISEYVTGFENEKCIYIEPDVNCLTKLSLFIANAEYEDLMETKYVLDVSGAVDQPGEVEGKDVSEDGN